MAAIAAVDMDTETDSEAASWLGVLSQEGFVKLECVAHDGTKVRAQAYCGPCLERQQWTDENEWTEDTYAATAAALRTFSIGETWR